MKVAIIGSRTISIENIEDYIPKNTTEIISGGAKGVDSCARLFAVQNNMPYTEFLPEYKKYGRAAPIKRNYKIVEYADIIIALWDGKSKGYEKCNRLLQQNRKRNTRIHLLNAPGHHQSCSLLHICINLISTGTTFRLHPPSAYNH